MVRGRRIIFFGRITKNTKLQGRNCRSNQRKIYVVKIRNRKRIRKRKIKQIEIVIIRKKNLRRKRKRRIVIIKNEKIKRCNLLIKYIEKFIVFII